MSISEVNAYSNNPLNYRTRGQHGGDNDDDDDAEDDDDDSDGDDDNTLAPNVSLFAICTCERGRQLLALYLHPVQHCCYPTLAPPLQA